MRKLTAFLGILLLSACLGQTPNSMFYSLQTIRPEQPVSMRKMSIAINRAVIPSYLDKPQIVMADADGVELQISEYQRWGENLASLLPRIMADDLGELLPNALVKPQSFTPQNYQYYLTLEVNRMDGTWNREAVLETWWSISDSQSRVIKRQKTSLTAPLGNSYEDYVQTQSRLMGELAQQIAQTLAKL